MDFLAILELIAVIVSFAFIMIFIVMSNPFSVGGKVEASLKNRLDKIEKHVGQAYFTLKASPIDLFELHEDTQNRGLMKGYVFDGSVEADQRTKMSCYLWALRERRFVEGLKFKAPELAYKLPEIEQPNSKLATALNSNGELMLLVNEMGMRIHLTTIYFGSVNVPVLGSDERLKTTGWIIHIPIMSFWLNRKTIKTCTMITEKIGRLIETVA